MSDEYMPYYEYAKNTPDGRVIVRVANSRTEEEWQQFRKDIAAQTEARNKRQAEELAAYCPRDRDWPVHESEDNTVYDTETGTYVLPRLMKESTQ